MLIQHFEVNNLGKNYFFKIEDKMIILEPAPISFLEMSFFVKLQHLSWTDYFI